MYVGFLLSLRNVEDLLAERGIDISYETVRFWWNWFRPIFAADISRQRVSRMAQVLCAEDQKRILLAVGFESVLHEGAEGVVAQRLAEFVDVNDESTTVEQRIDAIEHVHHQRRANLGSNPAEGEMTP